MKLNSLILDNFLQDPDVLLKHAHNQSFDGVKNPTDGVVYPDININIPDEVKIEILGKITDVFQSIQNPRSVIINPLFFMRRSIKDVHVPHQAHTDLSMGSHTLLLYLNKEYPDNYGTEIVEHKSGTMAINPQTKEQEDLWRKDTNTPDAWKVISFCKGEYNRGFILRSELFHRAQPVSGFGDNNENGRLVLVCFFTIDR